ncbi:MAG TPA: protein kinase [Kofleriaceae bacterium]|nr:protein kinase [Kofleriaceae bacterium]
MSTEASARTRNGGQGCDEIATVGQTGPFEIGELIGGAYRISGILGRGGMGVVYEAEDVLCRRRVALKTTAWSGGEALLRWEAQAAAAVRHQGLPTVYALGNHRGVPYLAMERLFGINLEEHLRKVGKLELVPALAILIPLAESLAALHDAGLAHRDIKPANIMLCPNGRIVLVDFGITLPEVDVPSTEQQTPMGTPTYMAPEAVAGTVKPGQAHFLDIYGFGGVAHEVLSGSPPFPSDNFVVVLQQQLSSDPPRLSSLVPDVPAALDAIVWRCLDKDPAERPSIESVLWELYGLTRTSLRGPRSALIVDDDPDAIELVKACAATRIPAAHVRAVATCETALWQVRRAPPDVLFVDLSLPGMSGLELCSVLHEAGLTQKMTVVAVSALQEDWILRALRNLGVRHFLPKGAGLAQQLVSMLDRLGRPRGESESCAEPLACATALAQGSQPAMQTGAPVILPEPDIGARPTQVAAPAALMSSTR